MEAEGLGVEGEGSGVRGRVACQIRALQLTSDVLLHVTKPSTLNPTPYTINPES